LTEKPTNSDKQSITGLFKSTHNVSDQVAGFMANTFLTLLDLADVSATGKTPIVKKEKFQKESDESGRVDGKEKGSQDGLNNIIPNLRYNIEIHLPATKDIEVYNAIFKSLREHLLNE
jgi:hypothetical protein